MTRFSGFSVRAIGELFRNACCRLIFFRSWTMSKIYDCFVLLLAYVNLSIYVVPLVKKLDCTEILLPPLVVCGRI